MKKKEACEKEILAYKKKVKKQYNANSRAMTNTTRGWGEYNKPFKFKIIVNDMAEVLRK